jgi:hypothetical protein
VPLLNYTTTIAAEKTVSEIQSILAKAGASAIMVQYDNEKVLSGIAFKIDSPQGPISFQLPAQIDRIYVLLQRDKKVPRNLKTRAQAAKVCWRIIKDWVAAQIAIIEAEQADMVEVFLPYAKTQSSHTVYESMLTQGFAALLEHKP